MDILLMDALLQSIDAFQIQAAQFAKRISPQALVVGTIVCPYFYFIAIKSPTFVRLLFNRRFRYPEHLNQYR